jgi:GNAT superfamily N-acetyltransferase
MDDADALRAAAVPAGVEFREVQRDKAAWSSRMYREVGAPWHWVDRASWTEAQWSAWTDRPEHTLILAEEHGVAAGYLELEAQGEGRVEIAYFGLLPHAVGRGIGGALLSEGIRRAWADSSTTRVWVHTCDLDGPAALPNYRSRGMEVFATETEYRLLPPAPGADAATGRMTP